MSRHVQDELSFQRVTRDDELTALTILFWVVKIFVMVINGGSKDAGNVITQERAREGAKGVVIMTKCLNLAPLFICNLQLRDFLALACLPAHMASLIDSDF